MLVAQRTRTVPGRVHKHLGRLQVFVPRETGHQIGRRRTHLRRRGRMPGRDGRVLAPVHQHGGLGVLHVPGRPATERRLEDVRGRGRVFRPGIAAGRMRRSRSHVCQHLRLVYVHVTVLTDKCVYLHTYVDARYVCTYYVLITDTTVNAYIIILNHFNSLIG